MSRSIKVRFATQLPDIERARAGDVVVLVHPNGLRTSYTAVYRWTVTEETAVVGDLVGVNQYGVLPAPVSSTQVAIDIQGRIYRATLTWMPMLEG